MELDGGDGAGQDAEAGRALVLGGGLEQQLHAQADAEQRLGQLAQRAAATLDISGRPFALIEGFERLPAGEIAGFEHEAAEEFFRAVATAAKLTLHMQLQAGTNAHHMIEACFKALARALHQATTIDPNETGVPSTKGTLT